MKVRGAITKLKDFAAICPSPVHQVRALAFAMDFPTASPLSAGHLDLRPRPPTSTYIVVCRPLGLAPTTTRA